MKLKGRKIGVAITGSFCTYEKVFQALRALKKEEAELQTIFSDAAQSIDSRFGNAEDFVTKAKEITGAEPMLTIPQAEPIGPKGLLDLLILMPCTGNSIAKLANGITDTPALMAAKAHLRNERPLLVSISTNDALGMNMKNIGLLLNTKHVYFVPFKQDNPQKKPNSMIASLEYLIPAAEAALDVYKRQHMECDVPYKYLQILGYGYRQARVQVQEHLHESVHHIDCESADWLPVQLPYSCLCLRYRYAQLPVQLRRLECDRKQAPRKKKMCIRDR